MDHRAPAPLRNHARENVLAMREKMRQVRGKNIIENMKPPQAQFKLKQFGNVKSRLFELPRPSPDDRVERRSPSCARPASQQDVQKEDEDGDGGADGEEVDLATFAAECERLKQQYGNKAAAPQQYKKDSAGRPAYLQRRKAELAEEHREAEALRLGPAIPAGYRQMPESERQETLETLQKKREELDKALQRLPFVIETAAQKKREQTILDKIKESEAAIKTFSNPRVLIAEA